MPVLHNSLWQAGSFQHLKAENRKGHLQGGDMIVLGFKKDRRLKAVESKKAYQYHHGYVTLNKPLVMIHS